MSSAILGSASAEALDPRDELHWQMTRPSPPRRLVVLAQDHRAFFESTCDLLGVDRAIITVLKELVFEGGRSAFEEAGLRPEETGFIVDADYGEPLLTKEPLRWRARPIEATAEPLSFIGGNNVAIELLRWPAAQVVKCKVTYHPSADAFAKRIRCNASCSFKRHPGPWGASS
ncbi:MAG: DUF2090 domain-containing protein [Myxococcales bacterium]|nr:DUF2090 domain-containing protein [Myxococcales bacterium]